MTEAALGSPYRPMDAYSGSDPLARFHVRHRTRSAPFEAIDSLVPGAGLVLDIGCGHGASSVWLAQSSPSRMTHGVDVSHAKLAHARRAVVVAGLSDDAIAALIHQGLIEAPAGVDRWQTSLSGGSVIRVWLSTLPAGLR